MTMDKRTKEYKQRKYEGQEPPKKSLNMPKDERALRAVLIAVIRETIPNLATLREKEWAMTQIENFNASGGLAGQKRMIKNTGIVRKVDELGRLVVPIELRRTMGWIERETVEVHLDDANGWIVIEPFKQACHFCASIIDVSRFKDKNICESCQNELLWGPDRPKNKERD